jgi:nuclear pore complex protein Nup62
MDEILTRWAADLSKYQKEFQKSAKQVAAWDTLLVKNTEKISKLYAKAFQAERDASEVEKQIAAVESEQEELDQWLSKYEGEVEDMIRKTGAGLESGAGGVDLEREKVYRVAERVTERLEGLNRDLGDVIDEVNGVSALVGKSSGPDDQVSSCIGCLEKNWTNGSAALKHCSCAQLTSPAIAGH